MKCEEAIQLWSSYHDGELDDAYCREIRLHLEQCAECRSFYVAQTQFDNTLKRTLQKGDATPSLWQREEAFVRSAFEPEQTSSGKNIISWWEALLWENKRFYGALAAAWVFLLIVNHLSDMDAAATSKKPGSALSQNRQALAEQRRELKLLLMSTDTDQQRAEVSVPGPFSEWRRLKVSQTMS